MDVLLRQHKADERERVRVLEEEEEAERRERRFKAALQARPTDTHVRLSKDFEVAKAKREALAEKLHADESVTSSVHAKDYKGPGGVDWAVIKERQETERLQRVAARRAWLQNQMQAPRMAGAGKAAHGSRAAEKENAMMAANGTRPRHATVLSYNSWLVSTVEISTPAVLRRSFPVITPSGRTTKAGQQLVRADVLLQLIHT